MQNPDMIADQKLFQQTFGHGVLPSPQVPDEKVQERRFKLVKEEFQTEFVQAWEKCNSIRRKIIEFYDAHPEAHEPPADLHKMLVAALAEMSDVIADSIYVLIGTAFEYGLPLALTWSEVQRANMAKLWTGHEVETHATNQHIVKVAPGFPPTESTSIRMYIVHDTVGKVVKPPSFTPPNIEEIIRTHLCPPDQQTNRDAWNKAVADADKTAEPDLPGYQNP